MDHRVRIAKDLFILNDYNTVNHLGQSSKFNQLLYPTIDKNTVSDSTYITKTVSSGSPYYFYGERDYTFIPTGVYLTIRGSGTPSITPLTLQVAYESPTSPYGVAWETIGRNHPSSGFNTTPTQLNLSRMLSDAERSGINSIFHHQNRLSGIFSSSSPTSESRHLGMFRLNINDGDKISYFNMTLVGDETYTNYETGIYGVDQSYYYPTGIYGIGSDTFSWKTGSGTPVHYARELQVPPTGIGADNEFIELFRANNDDEHLSLSFSCNEDSYQKVNRGILSLRAQYPHSGTYQSSWFSVLGYKCDKEHGGTNSSPVGSYTDDRSIYNARNHAIYGNGTTIWNSGWTNYTIPLSFINPQKNVSGIGGNYFSRQYDQSDIFKGIDLVVGPFPSGTRISAAELLLETEPSEIIECHIAGGNVELEPSGVWLHRASTNTKLYGSCPSYHSNSIFDVGYFKASGTNRNIKSLTSNSLGTYTGASLDYKDFTKQALEIPLYRADSDYAEYGYADKYHYFNSGDYINLSTTFNVIDSFSMMFVVPFFNDYNIPNGTIFLRGNDHSYYEFKLETSNISQQTTLTFYDSLDIEYVLTLISPQSIIELGYEGNTNSGEFYLKNYYNQVENESDRSGYITPRRKITNANSFVAFNYTGCIQEWGATSSKLTTEQRTTFFNEYWNYSNQLISSGNDINYMQLNVAYGSGNSVLNDLVQNLSYNNDDTELQTLLWPARLAYDNVDVYPSSIKLRMVTELNTSHTGVCLNAQLRGPLTNNNLTFNKCIPSGTKQTYDFYPDLTYNNQYNKLPVVATDDNYYLNLDVNYNDYGNYYGELKIYSIQLLIDGWVSPQTGTNSLNLYMSGIPAAHETLDLYLENTYSIEDLDLYIYGHSSANDDVDLFLLSSAAAEDVDLYLNGHALSSGNLDLFLNCASGITSAADYPSGVPLFIDGIYREDNNIPLYIPGLDPPNTSGSMNLWVWSTTYSGLFSSIDMIVTSEYDNDQTVPLYLDAGTGDINDYIPLYMGQETTTLATFDLYLCNYHSGINKSLNCILSSNTTPISGSTLDLFIQRDAEGVSQQCNLYIPVTEGMDDELNLYTYGTYIMASSVPMYASGIGVLNNRTNLYIHGF